MGDTKQSGLKVSVITPTYNRSNLLPRVHRSLKSQSGIFEWIVVDDGSTDDTSDTVGRLKPDVYIRLLNNSGVNNARNKGVEKAKGEFIIFLDSDDELIDGALAKMVDAAESAPIEIGVVMFSCLIAGSGTPISSFEHGKVLGEREIVCQNALRGGDRICIYRKAVFEDFLLPADLRGCEQVFVYSVSKAWRFLQINEPASVVHRQKDNLSNAQSVLQRSEDIAVSYERVVQNHQDILKEYPEKKAEFLLHSIFRYGVAGRRLKVLQIIPAALKIASRFQKPKILIVGFIALTCARTAALVTITWKNRRFTKSDL